MGLEGSDGVDVRAGTEEVSVEERSGGGGAGAEDVGFGSAGAGVDGFDFGFEFLGHLLSEGATGGGIRA